MLPSIKTSAVAGLLAAAVAATPAAPAFAWDKREQDFLKGALAAAAVGALLYNMNQQQRRVTVPSRQYSTPTAPAYGSTAYRQPVYSAPTYDSTRYIPEPPTSSRYVASSVYSTPAARAFNSYSATERQTIQRRLAALGYYRSGIDGQFGPGTYAALGAYARDQGMSDRLASSNEAFGVLDSLIY